MTDLIDFYLAATKSRSFRRFTKAMHDLIHAINSQQIVVTPSESIDMDDAFENEVASNIPPIPQAVDSEAAKLLPAE